MIRPLDPSRAGKRIVKKENAVRVIRAIVVLMLALLAASAAYLFWWLEQPLPLASANVQFSVPAGTSAQGVAERMHKAGVKTNP